MSELLEVPAALDSDAQNLLLAEVDKVFTEEDNRILTAEPTKTEVEESIKSSNLHAAPGTDGIKSYLYKQCFPILGDAMTEVAQAVYKGEQLSKSQRTSLMICCSKPGKTNSCKVRDK